MKNQRSCAVFAGVAIMLLGSIASTGASDFNDGISKFTDEPIAADDKLGDKDTNINYIITYAIGKAKAAKHQALRATKKELRTNYHDNSGDNNENSIVIEPGSKIDKVINVVVEQ